MTTAPDDLADFEIPPASLETSDEVVDNLDVGAPYCPVHLLETFCLLMAGHGRSINVSMMLGDREYAMWQLARAHAIDDAPLSGVASRLFDYFKNSPARVPFTRS